MTTRPETSTTRIRWEPNDGGRDYTAAYRGYAGTSGVANFVIYPPAEVLGRIREWVLRSDLPGQDHHFAEAPRREDLEPHAERWLEEFVTSLGVFFRFEVPVRPSLAGRRTRRLVVTVDTPEGVTDAELAAVFADMYADGPVLTGWWSSVPEIQAVPYLESGEERTGEEEPLASGNCPALSCAHLWSLHGPGGCTGRVFPDRSPGGKPCPCKRTGDGEPR